MGGALRGRHEETTADVDRQHRAPKAGERGGAIDLDVGNVVVRAPLGTGRGAAALIHALGGTAGEHADPKRLHGNGRYLAPGPWRQGTDPIDVAAVRRSGSILVGMDVEDERVKVGVGG
jgi:hypothetical protein